MLTGRCSQIFLDDIDSLLDVHGLVVGTCSGRRHGRGRLTLMGGRHIYQYRFTTGLTAGLDVPAAVANAPGLLQVDIHLLGRLQQHSRIRLAAVTFLAIFLYNTVRMVWAVIYPVQICVLMGQ